MKTSSQLVFYGLAIGAQKGFSFLLLPIATSLLTTEHYGQLNFLTTISAVLSLVLTFGQSEMLFRFVRNKDNLNQNLVFSLYLSMIGSFVLLILMLCFLDQLIALAPIQINHNDLLFLLLNLALSPFIALLLASFRLQQQAFNYFLVAALQAGSQTLFSVVLLYKGYGTTGVMFSGLTSSLMILVCFVVPVLRQLQYPTTLIQFEQIKKKVTFSAYITAASLCLYAANGVEHWFIAANYTAAELAYYFVASQLTLIGSFMFEPVRMWWYAKRYQLVKDNPKKYEELVIFCLAVALLICILLAFIIPIVINVLLPPEYQQSKILMPILILALAFRFKSELLNVGCYVKKEAADAFWINFAVGIVSICLLLAFSTSLGLIGIAYIVLAVQSARFVLFFYFSQQQLKLAYPFKNIFLLWVSLLGTLVADNLFTSFIVAMSCLVYVIVYATRLGILEILLPRQAGGTK